MPSRDPKTGKPLGGAAKTRRKKAQTEAERKREAKRASRATPAPPAPPVGLDFGSLPPPPLGDPLGAMQWWNDVLLVCADTVMRDVQMPLEQRVRFLADFSAKAGMIRDKAAESKALRESLRQRHRATEDSGLEHAGPAPPAVARPPG